MVGARQVGKTTILEQLKAQGVIKDIVTLDDLFVLSALHYDAYGYIKGLEKPVAIDEIQRFPALSLVLKKIMDEEKKKGQFVLTGSANILSLPDFKDSLMGRTAIFTIEGLSEAEFQGMPTPPSLSVLTPKPFTMDQIYKAVFYGGYPDICTQQDPVHWSQWFRSAEMAYIERDIRDMSRTVDIVEFFNVFHFLGAQSGNLLNYHTLGGLLGLDQRVIKRYVEMLSVTFQISILRPFYYNAVKRMVKTPKIYMNDSGHACFMQNLVEPNGLKQSIAWGHLFETWVYGQLRKLIQYDVGAQLSFYRTFDGIEVDFIIQKGQQLIAIECKTKMTLSDKDFQGVTHVVQNYPNAQGIVLYLGQNPISWGNNIRALPVSVLF